MVKFLPLQNSLVKGISLGNGASPADPCIQLHFTPSRGTPTTVKLDRFQVPTNSAALIASIQSLAKDISQKYLIDVQVIYAADANENQKADPARTSYVTLTFERGNLLSELPKNIQLLAIHALKLVHHAKKETVVDDLTKKGYISEADVPEVKKAIKDMLLNGMSMKV